MPELHSASSSTHPEEEGKPSSEMQAVLAQKYPIISDYHTAMNERKSRMEMEKTIHSLTNHPDTPTQPAATQEAELQTLKDTWIRYVEFEQAHPDRPKYVMYESIAARVCTLYERFAIPSSLISASSLLLQCTLDPLSRSGYVDTLHRFC